MFTALRQYLGSPASPREHRARILGERQLPAAVRDELLAMLEQDEERQFASAVAPDRR